MSNTRYLRSQLGRAALLAALGSALLGCTGEIGGAGGTGDASDGTGSSAAALICERLPRTPAIATNSREIGLSGASIPVAAGQLVLVLAPDVALDPNALAARLAAAGVCLDHVEQDGARAVVRIDVAADLKPLMRQLAAVQGVRLVELDPIFAGTDDDGNGKKNDNDGNNNNKNDDKGNNDDGQGNGKAPGTPSLWHLAALRMGPAFALQSSASGKIIALLDTGVDKTTPGLDKATILPGYDFVNGDADPSDDNGHGTLLAGIIASQGDFPGVAPGAALLPVKVLDLNRLGTESALVSGIDWAVAHGANVISMSLAFPDGFVPSFQLSRSVRAARAAGVVLVAASGNAGDNEIAYPAAFGDVIAVGGGRLAFKTDKLLKKDALNIWDASIAKKVRRAEYSQYGAAIDVLAPGGSMSFDLDGDGFPDGIPAWSFVPQNPSQHQPYFISGTSPAAAQAAGVSALLLASGSKPGSVLQYFFRGATALPPSGFDVDSGAGLVNAGRSLFQQKSGPDPTPFLPQRFVNAVVTLATDPQGNRRALAFVELVDKNNAPVHGSRVLGHFRGAVKHDVSAKTDKQGRALLVSLPAPAGSTVFEFAVDKIIETAHWQKGDGEGGFDEGQQIIIIPQEFSRFELATFRFMSSFRAGGQGPDPTPFMVFTPPDAIAPLVGVFAGDMQKGPDPTPFHGFVTTIPTDVASYTIVPSLTARSFGPAAGGTAPVVMAFDRALLDVNCSLSTAGIPIASAGSGLAPSPTRLGNGVTSQPLTADQVILRSSDLFLNGGKVTEAQLGLLFGNQGTVLVGVDGSICTPQGFTFTSLGLMAGSKVVMQSGITLSIDPNAAPPPPAQGSFTVASTALGAGNGQSVFASAGAMKASAQVQ